MTIAGIDIGTDYTQSVIVENGELIATGETQTGFDLEEALETALKEAIAEADVDEDHVDSVIVTGEGRKSVDADNQITSYRAIGHALAHQADNARTVLLMGAKNAAALKIDQDGNVLDFDENDKCAAGVGRFLSDLTRFLDMDMSEMIEAALSTNESVEELNTQCSVFAESEVISLIHEDVTEASIARGVHEAIAERNSSLIRRVGAEDDIFLVGGVGRNEVFLESLEENIGKNVHVPENPAHTAAYGAALIEETDADAEIEAGAEPGEKRQDIKIE